MDNLLLLDRFCHTIQTLESNIHNAQIEVEKIKITLRSLELLHPLYIQILHRELLKLDRRIDLHQTQMRHLNFDVDYTFSTE